MAAYAATVVEDLQRVERISRTVGIMVGTCNLTNYNTTLAEITDITRWFLAVNRIFAVLTDAVSDEGYCFRWNRTTGAFECFVPVHGHDFKFKSASITADVEWDGTDIATTGGGTRTPNTSSGVQAAKAFDAAVVEAADDVDAGLVNFVAYGLV